MIQLPEYFVIEAKTLQELTEILNTYTEIRVIHIQENVIYRRYEALLFGIKK